jgi:photosystem II stability/assembly factor-like uncharacterized protein
MIRRSIVAAALLAPALLTAQARQQAQPPRAADTPQLSTALLNALAFRSIGPTMSSGRIQDVAINWKNPNTWYVAAGSGGLWKTTNRGITFTPIFDQQGSYSMGSVVIDPKNDSIIWVGSGENTSQRSASFGDGVYKSTDAGRTWANVGLRNSEHIQKLIIDPRNSDVVWVAAQGPLWSAGGERGLYKTTDGGRTWQASLTIDENTGVTDVAMDPRNPDVLYAAAYQRRRHVGMLMGGGPGSGIYKTVDGGRSWKKIEAGLPQVNKGRIALAISPQQPDVIYAWMNLAHPRAERMEFWRSSNGGESWEFMSNRQVQDPQYYGEIFTDPHRFDRVYVVEMNLHFTDDGGKTWRQLPAQGVHVDHHSFEVNPADPNHFILGNDGGLYESFDQGATWRHFNNMPLSQFYRIASDNAWPFYNVTGGMQDNGSQLGPARSAHSVGVRTLDWVSTGGGDGMQSRVDPDNPSIVYSQTQGSTTRLDLTTGASKSVRPAPNNTQPTFTNRDVRWHWDVPLVISTHDPATIYMAGSRVFRSRDRGDSWQMISGDITRQINRDTLPIMGRLWPDSTEWVSRNTYTNDYGTSLAFDESPLQAGLLLVGTDDGVVSMSADGGATWTRFDRFPGVPMLAQVTEVVASRHDVNTFYVSFTNFNRGDFTPYILKTTDRGRTFTSIRGTLPDRHPVWSIAEDHVNPNLLFVGTEFGVFTTVDGGRNWVSLRNGVPTIAIRDLEIQRRESDLVLGTFGRGAFVLDDYSPLRGLSAQTLAQDFALLPMRHALQYQQLSQVRNELHGWAAPNPPYGALMTYYVRSAIAGAAPNASDSALVVTITGADGALVRHLPVAPTVGLNRVAWNLRAAPAPAAGRGGGGGFGGAQGEPVAPGKYTLQLARKVDGQFTAVGQPQVVEVIAVEPVTGQGNRR